VTLWLLLLLLFAPSCRSLRDIGRSIAAYGYWGDIINPPYHALGTVADDPALFKQVNKQFSHTSVDVAEHNILVRPDFLAVWCTPPWRHMQQCCSCILGCKSVHGIRCGYGLPQKGRPA
jgi:hypothetical protein